MYTHSLTHSIPHTQARSYAKNQGSRGSPGDSETKGYALDWDHEDRETYVFHTSHYTLISIVVVLNIFVLLTATVMTTFTYNAVYKEILHKRNPYYPLFWSAVVLSFLWNVGPSWLVLSGKYELVYYSLVFMVPLEGLVAVCIMKKGDFPVPLLLREGCPKHAGNLSIFDRTLIARCCINCLVSYTVQTLAIWTVIVFVTFLSYYMAAIIIAFYLYPTEVLVKVVFLKAVAVAAILNVALLFSNSRFKCKCKKLKHNLVYLVRVLAIAAFLPILGFLAFVIGGSCLLGRSKPRVSRACSPSCPLPCSYLGPGSPKVPSSLPGLTRPTWGQRSLTTSRVAEVVTSMLIPRPHPPVAVPRQRREKRHHLLLTHPHHRVVREE